jgi:hypothetical protein
MVVDISLGTPSFYKSLHNVILSEAKLQRSGQSSRGQAFHLGFVLKQSSQGK